MEMSILNSTKKVLGVSTDYTAFDLDIITFINSAFVSLYQLGVGPVEGFTVEDDSALWSDLALLPPELNLVKTYVYLKARVLFDPPTTSFLVDALTKQVQEHEWRLTHHRETNPDPFYTTVVVPVEEVIW